MDTVIPAYSSSQFEKRYTYYGSDLGAVWRKTGTSFRVWAPTAQSVRVNLYHSGNDGARNLLEVVPMRSAENGTWTAEKTGDLSGVYYTYTALLNGREVETCDPYARTTGVNGQRAMVIDLDSTNPAGWELDRDPNGGKAITDAVIYELHLRDLSMDPSSGIQHKGKFLGLTERGTVNSRGIPTGLDHILGLGVTHIHLLPVYDYGSVDESRLDEPQFNWGYDPVNYNVPEGSYTTDPYHGEVRIREMKQMIKTLHDHGISVIMDVVYNHVYDADRFCFNRLVPGYFSRMDDRGAYSDGSGCGNDTASERSMVRKYIVDSVKYWADEYHIDGFRFDLVGLIDVQTVQEIIAAVRAEHPNVIFYGEGWDMPTQLTKKRVELAIQKNSHLLPGFAFFSDTIRDCLKGSVFLPDERGFISGAVGKEMVLAQCFQGLPDWCASPAQSVNYASCHDNVTLFDRLAMSNPESSFACRVRMNKLAAAIYMTAQGVPFFQAGEEMLRTKRDPDGNIVENSYRSPDCVNALRWDDLNRRDYRAARDYYRGLIEFRKAHPALRMQSSGQVRTHVRTECLENGFAAFYISGETTRDTDIFCAFNANNTSKTVTLPAGCWHVCVDGEKAGAQPVRMVSSSVEIPPITAMMLTRSCSNSVK